MYDMKNLEKLKQLGKLTPEAFTTFLAFNEAVFKDGHIPAKYKELIAIAIALTTQCAYCIEDHKIRAKQAGATDEEIAEAAMLAGAMRAGGAIAHASHLL